eukprot:scaffold3752_cov117-Isochrysis_galbana.AAC.1
MSAPPPPCRSADAGPRIATGYRTIGHLSEELSGKTIAPRLSLNSFLKRQSIAIREGSPSGVDSSSGVTYT